MTETGNPSTSEPRASAVMRKDPVLLVESSTLADVIAGLERSDVGSVLIVDAGGQLSGIFTERDLSQCLAHGAAMTSPANRLMRRNPEAVDADAPISECARIMARLHCRHVPVVDRLRPVGTVTIFETQTALIQQLTTSLEALRMRDDYLGIVAHDVRSPLAVIESCCNFLLEEISDSPAALGGQVHALVDTMRHSAANGIKLVEELLDVGRLNSGAKLRCTLGSLSTLTRQVIEGLRPVAVQRRLTLVADVEPDVLSTIDAPRIAQALENLINNALKFTPAGRGVRVALRVEGTDARLSVIDEGPGVPPERLPRLFKKRLALDAAPTAGAPGSAPQSFGLGLSIAHQFVSLHKGTIEVANNPGGGSTFTIVLPGALRGNASEVRQRSQTAHILVVDDDEEQRGLMRDSLTAAGYDVHTAADGQQAWAKFQAVQPDLVVTDVRMPGIDGFTLLRRIKAERPKLPVILLSGFFPSMDDQRAIGLFHADRYLAKPVNRAELAEAVKTCLWSTTAA